MRSIRNVFFGLLALAMLAGLGVSSVTATERHGVTVLQATLTGAVEVNSDGEPNQGDLDGIGLARVALDERNSLVCVHIRVRDIEPITLAHIHRAPAGQNGPVAVDVNDLIDGKRVRGCVSVDAAIIERIKNNPANYYINIHSAEFKAGAVRGQLGE
jgi:hypothetical protein